MSFLQKYFGSASYKRLVALVLSYALVLSLALFFAFSVRFYGQDEWDSWSIRFILTGAWFIPLQIVALALRRHFSGILSYFRLPELYRLVQALVLAAIAASLISYSTGEIRLLQRGKMLPVLEWIAGNLGLDRLEAFPLDTPAEEANAATTGADALKPADAGTLPQASSAAAATAASSGKPSAAPALANTKGRVTPYMVILADSLFALLFICFLRILFRVAHDIKNSNNDARKSGAGRPRRMAIVGAGDVGAALAADWLARPGLRRQPIVFLDDNKQKHGLRIHNIPIVGDIAHLGATKRKYNIDEIVIAIGKVPPARIREITELARTHNLPAEVVPSLIEMASGRTPVSRIRSVEIQDLLGRDQIELDNAAIGELICGKTVLVTGAGGSIGSELCRQIVSFAPGRLLLVERCEVQLFKIEQNLIELGGGPIVQPLLGDITDEARMRHILALHKPDLVFHAAAHKHVFLMERQPWEAIRNNTLGTRLLIDLAIEYGIPRFVLISTDKAINPTSIMGATKRMAEIYLQARQNTVPRGTDSAESTPSPPPGELPVHVHAYRTRLMAVRFGNVLGSSGSVVPIFTKQIAEGGPVRVTHPDVTRYFMTIPEAVSLVLQSTVLGNGGEIFVLNMGKPMKITDLARQMIELSGLRPGADITIEYIGLRPGEKLYEELSHNSETHATTGHPDIMRFISPPGDLAAITADLSTFHTGIYNRSANTLKLAIQKIVPEYRPHFSE